MADDASGGDGDDARGPPSTDPDVHYPDDEGRAAEHDWDRTGRDDRSESDEGTDAVVPDADGDEYRIPLDLSGSADGTAPDGDDADGDDPYAPEPSSTPIEPGDPSLESAVFVVLGAVAMLLVLFRLAGIAM